MLSYLDDAVRVRVADDGCGFDVHEEQSASRQSLGLISMRERAGIAGMTVDVRSVIGAGTDVTISAPIR